MKLVSETKAWRKMMLIEELVESVNLGGRLDEDEECKDKDEEVCWRITPH